MTFKNNREPLLCYFKLCPSFCSHWWIQTGVKSPETPNLGQIWRFLVPCDLEIWQMTLKNNRAPLLNIIKLYASFHHHMLIQTRVTVRKRLSWVLTSVTLTFDLWTRPFAWTSLLSLVITPENFMMIRWWEYGEKGVTDGQTDGRMDWTSHIAAWSQLKTIGHLFYATSSFVQHFVPIQGSTLTVVRLGIPSLSYCRTTWTSVYGCPLVKFRKLIK